MTNPQLIAAAGRALFGAQWQVPLAQALGINERTMRRIAQAEREGDDYRVSPGVLRDLQAQLATRQTELENVAAALGRLLLAASGAEDGR